MAKSYGGYDIDDSTLQTFVNSLCCHIKISRSPGVKTGSTKEMYYALWEVEKIFREIFRWASINERMYSLHWRASLLLRKQ